MSSIPSGSYFLPSLLQNSQKSTEREGFNGDISFMAEYSKISHSLHYVWLCMGICICFYLLQEEASQKMIKQSTDLSIAECH